jgi:hypothetical protein
MPRNKPDDPFDDADWGPQEGSSEMPDEMPGASTEERPPYLKPHHLAKAVERGSMQLIRVTGETSEYSDVVLLVELGGKQYRLGMKLFSDDYKALSKRFGKKRSDWKGELRFKVMPHKGNPRGFIAVR